MLFRVKTEAALIAPASAATMHTSRLPFFLIPALTPEARKPSGATMPPSVKEYRPDCSVMAQPFRLD